MPVLEKDDYQPTFIFKNGDLNTFYPPFFRERIDTNYIRKRVTTPDDDFLDLDLIQNNNNAVAIVLHGLEGSSQSQYMLSISSILAKNQMDVIAVNFRSCSGEMNKQLRLYHSGETTDLDFVIQQYENKYKEIYLIGYSLGGNVVLKYCGERSSEIHPKIKKAIGISVPVDLKAGAFNLIRFRNKLYANNFLKTLTKKTLEKHEQFPKAVNIDNIYSIKNLIEFDDRYTAPIHGFKGAMDYYERSSSKQFLSNICIPSLLITAEDDPFLPNECYPYEIANQSKNFNLLVTQYGGHVGYTTQNERYYWSDKTILKFIKDQL